MSASIEIPGRSSIHNSEQDFVVISESPVVQLSEGDVLDGLELKMDSFGVHSISLKDDIERLTRENEQLKQTALNDGQAMRKHLQLCTEYKEQMTKCHDRDAAMLEEARQSTLKLQEENAALNAVLENVQVKLEEAVMREHETKTSNTRLEKELETLREDLAAWQSTAEEARQRAEESSYVRIENGAFDTEPELLAELTELRSKLRNIEEKHAEDPLPGQLQEKLNELEKELVKANEEKTALEEQLNQRKIAEIESQQTSESSSDQEAARRLSVEASLNQKVVAIAEKLTQANLEKDRLREKLDVSMEQKTRLENEVKALEAKTAETLRSNIAAFECLQSEQASQKEALRMALRSEQSLREKAQKDYASLLETWQNFESNYQPPVDLGADAPTQRSDIDRAAENLATADRLRLEADNRSLREAIKDLQAQNMRLLQELQVNTVQQAGGAAASAAVDERKCPICMQPFENQADLIQHAGICENELASIF
ncbi:paramyosin-like [Galendromus occidentalis]|uniref:Paramyosin-like n=1 Tax=Galendromus occidentalis TaxID=34638 RepID=A0AAJ7SH75_9ACAR|nr:paramyosin-like [Galendromus occidentalis]